MGGVDVRAGLGIRGGGGLGECGGRDPRISLEAVESPGDRRDRGLATGLDLAEQLIDHRANGLKVLGGGGRCAFEVLHEPL